MKENITNIDYIRGFYTSLPARNEYSTRITGRALTLSEKILYSHLYDMSLAEDYKRGTDYVNFFPDRVAMQDATAQMALLQFMNSGRSRTAVDASVHCDHLIIAEKDSATDLSQAFHYNSEVYEFLSSVSARYGITYWKPGSGIIHQVVLENYAFPGGMMIGTDSHTPNAGGLGMLAIGVGGADAVDVMAGMEWELKMPRLIGVRLTGRLSGWTSPKDVILKLAGELTVKGATNAIIEYFGDGVSSIPATGKATICNMGAEVGATTSVFPYDARTAEYLIATGRAEIAEMADKIAVCLRADQEVLLNPERFYDVIIDIDLSSLEPHINGPFTPDAAWPISRFVSAVKENGYPQKVEAGLIGSCTNSSYEDLSRAASIARQVREKGIEVKGSVIVNPGSEKVRSTTERDRILDDFKKIGGVIMASACGPCIGQWRRQGSEAGLPNSIVTSFNRNFAGRNDGNPNTHAFVASPEITMALAVAGDLCFNPITDTLAGKDGREFKLEPPSGNELPADGFDDASGGFILPESDGSSVVVIVNPESERLKLLEPFDAWDGKDMIRLPLLLKVKGKCTTDHISMAGPWLRYRGHLGKISDNLLMGAANAFNGRVNCAYDVLGGVYDTVSAVAKHYKQNNISSVVVAEDNYGEGSSREHAAMEPRFLNVKVILARSFARIHETNLKKQGMLALTFKDAGDYDKIMEDDRISVTGLDAFMPGQNLVVTLHHSNGTDYAFEAKHTFNEQQIHWFKAGSALNSIR